jgi:lysophospholipase L1-like esterase
MRASIAVSFAAMLLASSTEVGAAVPAMNATDARVRTIGRGAPSAAGSGWQFDWPNLFIISVSQASTVTATMTATKWCRFRVWFHSAEGGVSNGRWAPMSWFWVAPGTNSYILASGMLQSTFDADTGPITIALAKSTEADYNGSNETDWRVTVESFSLPEGGSFVANANPPLPGLPLPSRRLEFIGDSITASYGIGGFEPCAAKPWNQEAARSYPQLICSALEAECHVQAWSGRGLVKNYQLEEPGTHMPEIERRVWASVLQSPEWDFSSWVPQAVWINLGTNDACCGRAWPVAGYQDTYVELLMNITQRYGGGGAVTIFAAYGPMSSVYKPQVEAAAAAANAQGAKVVVVDQSTVYDHPNSHGCWGHPSSVGHALMAESGVAAIASALGWQAANVTGNTLSGSLAQWVL